MNTIINNTPIRKNACARELHRHTSRGIGSRNKTITQNKRNVQIAKLTKIINGKDAYLKIAGNFLFVCGGDTYPIQDELKNLGFEFINNKWFWSES